MKFKGFVTVVFLLFIIQIHANQFVVVDDTTKTENPKTIDPDSLMNSLIFKSENTHKRKHLVPRLDFPQVQETRASESVDNLQEKAELETAIYKSSVFTLPANLAPVKIDTLLLKGNPFFIDLVFMGLPQRTNWSFNPDFRQLYYGKPTLILNDSSNHPVKKRNDDDLITDLRTDARNEITRSKANFYCMTFDQLPDPKGYKNYFIPEKPLDNVQFVDENRSVNYRNRRIFYNREKLGPWQYKASSMAQFSESLISDNWYQGGKNNLAVLGILSGQLTYDDKKCIQWDNFAEWRMGFNSVAGDTIHWLSTNDDVLKINSKLGIKAGGNFFYSGSVDFSTQFFDSYNGVNSTVRKTAFLTPVRLNVGVGLDYKFKKVFSLLFSPISYKYIYVNDPSVDPNFFGVKKGENHLSEVGSSFKATLCYPVTKEIQLDSRLSFYTNYQKVEIDWEVVANMTINRFMSTRISFNPRYDNTVIMAQGQHAELQFKQLLSVGFSHKFY